VLDLAGPRLRAMLDAITVQQASPKLLRLGVPESRSAMARDHLPDIVRLVQETGARSMSIQFVDIKPKPASKTPHADTESDRPSTDGTPEAGEQQQSEPSLDPREADNHPLVRRAAEVFGAKVTHIHPKRRP
jgi:hypothetical protein